MGKIKKRLMDLGIKLPRPLKAVSHFTEKETADLAARSGDFYALAAEEITKAGYPGASIIKSYQGLVQEVVAN